MSYSGFHLAFNLPLLLILFFLSGKGFWPGEVVLAMVAILGIVVAFTSPWDNCAGDMGLSLRENSIPYRQVADRGVRLFYHSVHGSDDVELGFFGLGGATPRGADAPVDRGT